ncbi:MAG: pantoate--beta-alanine ligase [Gammaproteobacteria bacterium]|nr:pantoate--beta-alanine ligase [Gammaproteobacteria bacterium]
MNIVTTFEDARAARRGVVALVPTMGYFHEGHLSLIRSARTAADTVLVSLFVNPLQFGEGEDLDRYPRDLDRDASLADDAGADVLFAPSAETMYPVSPAMSVTVGSLADHLCGAYRPGHFEGVATVVAKLFAGLQPDLALFGRKDAQQLAVLRRLAVDLSFPVRVIGRPIVREQDGLALSSRNIYLSADQRRSALALSRGLARSALAALDGERSAAALESIVRTECEQTRGVEVQYVQLVDAQTVQPIPELDRDAFLAIAAHVGKTRLIDNVHFWLDGDKLTYELGERLDRATILGGN